MEPDEIEQLLERYWAGETSLEEEACLRNWFAKGDIPGHLQADRIWFDYLKEERKVHLDDDFIGKQMTAPSVALSVEVAAQKDGHLMDSLQRVVQQAEQE